MKKKEGVYLYSYIEWKKDRKNLTNYSILFPSTLDGGPFRQQTGDHSIQDRILLVKIGEKDTGFCVQRTVGPTRYLLSPPVKIVVSSDPTSLAKYNKTQPVSHGTQQQLQYLSNIHQALRSWSAVSCKTFSPFSTAVPYVGAKHLNYE